MPAQAFSYRPQLDGLRAIAILAVLISHFRPFDQIDQIAHWGRLGVLLFFVLSGFLITTLLLKSREYCDSGNQSLRFAFGTFYARRTLRIFPIYYITIAYFWIVGYPPIADFMGWHLTYTSNVANAFFGVRFQYAGHLWSLCVEEQFYLAWPALMLLLPRRLLLPLILSAVALGVAYKFVGSLSGLNWFALSRSVFGCMETLGMGSLLALCTWRPANLGRLRSRLDKACLFIGIPALLALQGYRFLGISPWQGDSVYIVLVDLTAALAFFPLVLRAADSSKWRFGKLLALKPLRYLGKISYGVYLFHLFLPYLLGPLWAALGVTIDRHSAVGFLLYSGAAIMLASISWHLVESPVNALKKRFPYQSRHSAAKPMEAVNEPVVPGNG